MIAAKLPGRTDNEIKNVWNTHLKKKLCRNGATTISDLNRSTDSPTGYSSSASASSASCISYGDINRQQSDSDGHRFSSAVVEGDPNQDPNKGESLSPCNSYISTTNVQSLIGGVDEEPEPTSTTTTTETKEEAKVSKEKMINEIPSDNDVEFWNWFESLTNPTLPRDEQSCEEFGGQEERESQKMMVGEEGGEEYKNWLKYLENELGLADFGGEESENGDLMFRSEMWPSPPPSHGFGI